ncbi:putative NBD/HSP70 family sugar kinase [Neobacillus niacini]|nr:putative NBD/HSP70 family sugar kinase [Neobacillus niacini]
MSEFLPTTVPEETMTKVIEFFKGYTLEAIQVGSFGPIDVNRESLSYGSITSTPKQGWRDYPIVKALEKEFGLPIGFNTDVNAAALGEVTLGSIGIG